MRLILIAHVLAAAHERREHVAHAVQWKGCWMVWRRRRAAVQSIGGASTAQALPPLHLLQSIGLGAAGRDDLDAVAFRLADQRARQRRRYGDLAVFGVRLRLAHDLPD